MIKSNFMGLTRYRAPYGAATQVSPCVVPTLVRATLASGLRPAVRVVACNKRDYSHPLEGMSHHSRPGPGHKRSIRPQPLPFYNTAPHEKSVRSTLRAKGVVKPGRSWYDTTMPYTVPTAMSQSLPSIGRLSSLPRNRKGIRALPGLPRCVVIPQHCCFFTTRSYK